MSRSLKGTLLIVVCITGLIMFGVVLKANNAKSQKQDILLPKPAHLSHEDLHLGELSIGMGYDRVIEIMKIKPNKIEKDEEGDFITISYKDGTEIVITNHAVQDISVTSNKYPTPRGLVVGDKKEKVLQLYGKPINEESEDIWNYSIGDDPVNFSVYFKKRGISMLEVNVQEI